jgi:phosphotriesterase-related protein
MYRPGVTKISLLIILSILLLSLSALSASAQQPEKATPPGMINSVLGPISPDKLGQTLMHEHFTFSVPGWFADATIAPEDFKAALKTNLGHIKTAKALGIKTIVDATPNDTGGRDPKLYKALAQKGGINIICSTGLYFEHGGCPTYWKQRIRWGTDISKMMSELFIKEITQGIGKTGVKAGVIKVGTSPKMTPYEEAVFKAAVVAQKATGVPIITHTEGPTGGVEQAEFFIKEGADLKKVMIGHVSNSKDTEYHKAILAKGVYIAFDRIGIDTITPFDVNVKNVTELCKLGYAEKIILSHDNVLVRLGRPVEIPEKSRPLYANRRIDHISKDVIPALKSDGVTDEQIKAMMVDNPKNLFLGN